MPSSIAVDRRAAPRTQAHTGGGRYYRRFGPIERVMHALLMLTFIGCALTGVPLLFADHDWAGTLVALMGGFRGAALIHRICAAIMTVIFVGGYATQWGSLVVAPILYGVPMLLPSAVQAWRIVIYGAALILVLVLKPEGFVTRRFVVKLERTLSARRRRRNTLLKEEL